MFGFTRFIRWSYFPRTRSGPFYLLFQNSSEAPSDLLEWPTGKNSTVLVGSSHSLPVWSFANPSMTRLVGLGDFQQLLQECEISTIPLGSGFGHKYRVFIGLPARRYFIPGGGVIVVVAAL